MNKLSQVQKALEENPNIVIVSIRDRNYLPGKCGYLSHTVKFFVAPKTGVYHIHKLQALMMLLVPGLELTCKDDFRWHDNMMEFGTLFFDEKIGEARILREITLTDKSIKKKKFLPGSKMIDRTNKTEDVLRRTWVTLFPDAAIATSAFKDKDQFELEYHISRSNLAKHRKKVEN